MNEPRKKYSNKGCPEFAKLMKKSEENFRKWKEKKAKEKAEKEKDE